MAAHGIDTRRIASLRHIRLDRRRNIISRTCKPSAGAGGRRGGGAAPRSRDPRPEARGPKRETRNVRETRDEKRETRNGKRLENGHRSQITYHISQMTDHRANGNTRPRPRKRFRGRGTRVRAIRDVASMPRTRRELLVISDGIQQTGAPHARPLD